MRFQSAVIGLLATAFTAIAQNNSPDAEPPANLLAIIRNEPAVQRCVSLGGSYSERMYEGEWLDLTANHRTFLLEGLPPCLAGNDNGTKLLYVQTGTGWRKILDVLGKRVEVAETSTSGWHDIVLWQHDSGFRSARHLLRFDGMKYKDVSCNMVQLGDPLTGKRLSKPRYTDCTEEFRELIPK
jgi:hypothetical protein